MFPILVMVVVHCRNWAGVGGLSCQCAGCHLAHIFLTMLCSCHSVENGVAWLCLRSQRSYFPVAGSLKVLTGPSCLVCSPLSHCASEGPGTSRSPASPGFPMHMCLFLPLGFGFCVSLFASAVQAFLSVAACLSILLFYGPCVLLIESWCYGHAQKT